MQVENVLPALCGEGKWNIGHQSIVSLEFCLMGWTVSTSKQKIFWCFLTQANPGFFFYTLVILIPFPVFPGSWTHLLRAGHHQWHSGIAALAWAQQDPHRVPGAGETDPAQVTAGTGLSTASCVNRGPSCPGSSCVFSRCDCDLLLFTTYLMVAAGHFLKMSSKVDTVLQAIHF